MITGESRVVYTLTDKGTDVVEDLDNGYLYLSETETGATDRQAEMDDCEEGSVLYQITITKLRDLEPLVLDDDDSDEETLLDNDLRDEA
jgi:hypothetical protein